MAGLAGAQEGAHFFVIICAGEKEISRIEQTSRLTRVKKNDQPKSSFISWIISQFKSMVFVHFYDSRIKRLHFQFLLAKYCDFCVQND